jgi:hypothetical protein
MQADTTCAWPLCVLQKEGGKFGLSGSMNGLGADVKLKLVQAMSEWMPHWEDGQQVKYNKVGFWMHALRFARNVGTHRSLALIRHANPASVGDPNPIVSMMVKVPVNPAMAILNDYNAHQALAFGTLPLKHVFTPTSNGFCLLSIKDMVTSVHEVAFLLEPKLLDILGAVMPKVTSVLAYTPNIP